METEEFQVLLRKYNNISKQQRMESLQQEEQELRGNRSPTPKYYEGTRTDRLQQVEAETEILREMDQMARQKIK